MYRKYVASFNKTTKTAKGSGGHDPFASHNNKNDNTIDNKIDNKVDNKIDDIIGIIESDDDNSEDNWYLMDWLATHDYHYGPPEPPKRRARREKKKKNKKPDNKPRSPKPGDKPGSPKPGDKPGSPKPDDKPGSPKPKSPKPETPEPESPEPTPEPPKEEPPKEELAKVLNVKGMDLLIQQNAFKHRTDMFECTEDRKDDDGKDQSAELVLRRGDTFDFKIEFDRPYDKEKHDMRLEFSYGSRPKPTNGTLVNIKMDESGKPKFKPRRWGASLESKSGNSITVRVHIPCNVIIGIWDVAVKSLSEGKDKDGKDTKLCFTYDHNEDITILFNPWCPDDTCYMAETDLLNEYVLNESGVVHQGNPYHITGKAWNFGQFEDGVLEAALYVMQSGFRTREVKALSNPVQVCRRLALMLNSSQGGVLWGNWSGDYEGGKKPWEWNGSVAILKEYMKYMTPVKFGQCWVFSAITTTVCRCLGIPARSVTNFSSAHDTEKSNTIDKYVDEDGNKLEEYCTDSVWNFHVWNEAWMARPDLADSYSGMDGWQVIDSTPQEESMLSPGNAVMTCGPSPVKAIKTGNCRVNYDTDFIFSETNADEVTWSVQENGEPQREKINRTKIGKRISTKKPDGQPYPPADYNPNDRRDAYRNIVLETRLDLTNHYKNPEGSEEERLAVLHAHETARNKRSGVYDQPEVTKDVKVALDHSNEITIGSPLPLEVKATNESNEDKVIEKVVFTVFPETYTGRTGKPFFKKEFLKSPLPVGKDVSVNVTLEPGDYLKHLVEKANIAIQVYIIVGETPNKPIQRFFKTHNFEFSMPELDVEGPGKIKLGEKAKFHVSFKNPLDTPLTKAYLYVEGASFRKAPVVELGDIPPKETVKVDVELQSKRKHGKAVQFTLDTTEIQDINEAVVVNIE